MASLLLTLGAVRAQAAEATGWIRVMVVDDGGESIPGSRLTLTCPTLLEGSRQADTDAEGRYTFKEIPPSPACRVKVEKAGFTPVTRAEIIVRAGQITHLPVELRAL